MFVWCLLHVCFLFVCFILDVCFMYYFMSVSCLSCCPCLRRPHPSGEGSVWGHRMSERQQQPVIRKHLEIICLFKLQVQGRLWKTSVSLLCLHSVHLHHYLWVCLCHCDMTAPPVGPMKRSSKASCSVGSLNKWEGEISLSRVFGFFLSTVRTCVWAAACSCNCAQQEPSFLSDGVWWRLLVMWPKLSKQRLARRSGDHSSNCSCWRDTTFVPSTGFLFVLHLWNSVVLQTVPRGTRHCPTLSTVMLGQRHRDTGDTETGSQRDRYTHTDKHIHRHKHRDKHRETRRQTDTQRHTHFDTNT